MTLWSIAHQASLSREILQTRILEWVAMPASKGIFPTQILNPGLLNCRWILYHLSHQGSPSWVLEEWKLARQDLCTPAVSRLCQGSSVGIPNLEWTFDLLESFIKSTDVWAHLQWFWFNYSEVRPQALFVRFYFFNSKLFILEQFQIDRIIMKVMCCA